MPLAFTTIAGPGPAPAGLTDGAPRRWMLFLHGILGRGGNWRGIAKRFVAERPGWSAALVDLRLHGRSHDADLTPPHTLQRCASDLDAVAASLASLGGEVRGVLGHSFGGKVAMTYIQRIHGDLDEAWIVDSQAGPARVDPSTQTALAFLRELPEWMPTRESMIEAAQRFGLARGLAEWLAMNLVNAPRGDGYVLGIDLAAVEEMIASYVATDLWPLLEAPPGHVEIGLIVGGKSQGYSAADVARAESLRAQDRVALFTPPTGHWVHAEDPDGVVRLLAAPPLARRQLV